MGRSDLFRINKNAHTFTREQLTGKLKSLGEGKLSPAVLANMVKTFLELVKLADFSGQPSSAPPDVHPPEDAPEPPKVPPAKPPTPAELLPPSPSGPPSLVYRIEIVLPAVRDQAVYDAIFRSVREHLF